VRTIPTNYIFTVPEGYELQVRANREIDYGFNIELVPLSINSQTTDEVKLTICNRRGESMTLKQGQKIAQLVLMALPDSEMIIRE
jgi:dUTPase